MEPVEVTTEFFDGITEFYQMTELGRRDLAVRKAVYEN